MGSNFPEGPGDRFSEPRDVAIVEVEKRTVEEGGVDHASFGSVLQVTCGRQGTRRMPVEDDEGIALAADHRQGLRDLGIVLVEVLGEVGILILRRERSPVLAQVQRKEVAALATLPISKRVLIVVGEVGLKEVVDVPVEIEDGAVPLAMQRTPDDVADTGPS